MRWRNSSLDATGICLRKMRTIFPEQCLNNVEPGAMCRCMHKFKSIGARGQIGAGFFGGVSGVVVKDDADYAIGGIVDIKIF